MLPHLNPEQQRELLCPYRKNAPEQESCEPGEILETHARWLWVRDQRGEERPVYLDSHLEFRIESYFALTLSRPELFRPVDAYPITLDRKAMLDYLETHPGKELGLVFSNEPYTYTLCDLIDGKYAYARVVPCREEAGGVILPVWTSPEGSETRIGLLVNARHAPRLSRMYELPRGHLEAGNDLDQQANALKELKEELKISPMTGIEAIEELGCVHPDSGLTAGLVRLYAVRLRGSRPEANVGEEGIRGILWKPLPEVLNMVRSGEITDGFTKAALLHYLLEHAD